MKMLLLRYSLVIVLLAPGYSTAQLKVVNSAPYADRFGREPMRPYTNYISAMVPAPCIAALNIRSANSMYSGDYFWPLFGDIPSEFSNLPQFAVKPPGPDEKQQIMQFLNDYFPLKFQNPNFIDSGQTSINKCLYTPDSIRHEFYLMLSEGDTVYVISGWLGKFMSLFRATPYDKKLTPADFIAQVIQIAPKLGKLGISDQMVKVDTGKVWDEKTYFLQSYEISNRLWLRHYPISVVLPPADPVKGSDKQHNLIEISKIYDKELFDGRLNQVLYRR